MAELNRFTRQLQSMLPQWMKMAKDPKSIGAQFLNVFGLEFEDVKQYLEDVINEQYIETANISQIDIIYKAPMALPTVVDMSEVHTLEGFKEEEAYPIELVGTLREFYNAPLESHVAIIDRSDSLIYIKPANDLIESNRETPYDYININGTAHYELSIHHIWNVFDEFGMLLGLQRLHGERNESFKERILGVFINPANATKEGLLNGISRELGISKDEVLIDELANPAFKDSLLNHDGTPTQKLIDYAERVNKVLGFTWDNMSWGEAYWKSVEEANIGFDYLPHIWDVHTEKWNEDDFQSGVGDGDDLLVRGPEDLDNTRNFKYYVGVRGSVKDSEVIHPEHSFKYKIVAKGTILNQESRPENYKYTIIASEIIDVSFVIRAYQKYRQTTTIDFSNLSGYEYDNERNLEVVDGTANMSPKKDRFLEVIASLETRDKKETSSLDRLTVTWKDTSGGTNNLVFDNMSDFDRNDSSVDTTKQDVFTTEDGSVELGYGDFFHIIDSKEDFEGGTSTNVQITNEGSIRLTPPKV